MTGIWIVFDMGNIWIRPWAKALKGIQWEVALSHLWMQPYVSAVVHFSPKETQIKVVFLLGKSVWRAHTSDTYGSIHRTDRGFVI